jgi:hypothetical protein
MRLGLASRQRAGRVAISGIKMVRTDDGLEFGHPFWAEPESEERGMLLHCDSISLRCSWQPAVEVTEVVASHRAATIGANASWFEEHAPTDPRFKRGEPSNGPMASAQPVAIGVAWMYPAEWKGLSPPGSAVDRHARGDKERHTLEPHRLSSGRFITARRRAC